jgi:hypothetical protein
MLNLLKKVRRVPLEGVEALETSKWEEELLLKRKPLSNHHLEDTMDSVRATVRRS